MSSAAGAAGASAAAAEAARVAGIRRKLEGDQMSIWVVNQEKDRMVLAIGFRVKGSRLQAQNLGSGSWETVGRFMDHQSCRRALHDITARLSNKDTRQVEVPAQ
jgi:hypothetical protein